MESGAVARIRRILVTGPPGVGKTTLCKEIAVKLREKGKKIDGFYTEEVRGESGSRIGFDVVPLQNANRRSILARSENAISGAQRSKYKVGNYHVFLSEFEAAALPVLNSNADVLMIDEIGKMELFSEKFHDKMLRLFTEEPSDVFIIATICEPRKLPPKYSGLFAKLSADRRCKVVTVSRQNRDNLVEEILRSV